MEPDDSVMLFLPLAHSFAQVVKAAWLGMGFRMIFAESVDKLLANLAETQPTDPAGGAARVREGLQQRGGQRLARRRA